MGRDLIKTDGEAIAVLQEQMNTVKEDVDRLQTDVSSIKRDTTKILETILILPQQYITHQVFEQYRSERQNMFDSFKLEMDNTLRTMKRRSWVQNTLSAALGILFGAAVAATMMALIQGRIH